MYILYIHVHVLAPLIICTISFAPLELKEILVSETVKVD